MMKVIGVYGASGFGREVLPLVRKQRSDAELCFIDDGSQDTELNGYSVHTYQDFLSLPHPEKCVVIAIANSQIRESLAGQCLKDKLTILSIQAPNAVVMDEVEVGEGAVLCHFTHLTSNIRIGKQFQLNIYSYVAHDCVIGDYVTFAPKVQCNGNVHVEDHAYIGAGAIIRQGTPDKPLRIGEGAVVGMGAVVTKDVPAGVTVVGNPARILERK